ncbi:DUF1045 domain-containing protein [Methyloligella sp. 2.7D]|uniref:DUF1045 domain-containing protein n=1 Tax=unclassified Methyloligella TaxID=2625955 RepID=UPI00157D9197|nr:DUF1045 domain-containing protein [Methyloligella sp. GL2]QKP77172.1 DUF1045 domain-containing protein [Methyloligella sp. GL2]
MLPCKKNDVAAPNAPLQSSSARYAIFFTPRPDTTLAAFSRSWFGRIGESDALDSFADQAPPETKSAPSHPNRYHGLHVAFKAPFALREEKSPDGLNAELQRFAAKHEPVSTGPLALVRQGNALALAPQDPALSVAWLEAQCINAFDEFSDALSAEEREQHFPHLSPYQRLLLESFGDPHAMSEFRFSIRLTGRLEPAKLEQVAEALAPVLDVICREGIEIDALSLMAAPKSAAPLRVVGRHSLGA